MSQTRTEMTELLARHDLVPRKKLGQHFLADQNMVNKIVALAGDPQGVRALEVGAGTGTLTRALAEAGFAVTAYEVDEGLRPLLAEVLDGLSVDLRFVDAVTIDPGEFGEDEPWVFVANLPYNVGTPILLDLLRHAAGVGRFVVMVQRQVADRLTAEPGTKKYGLPSVVADLFGTARFEFRVPPQVFVPPPNVDSAVVSVQRHTAPGPLRELAVQLASAGFAHRRKMLRTSLRSVVSDPEPILEQVGIAATLRAEDLTSSQYLDIARLISG